MTADFMCAIVQTEELEQLGQYMIKQLKNRYSDPNINKRFVIGVDKSRMKLFDVQQQAQNIQGSGQAPATTKPPEFRKMTTRRTKGFDGIKT